MEQEEVIEFSLSDEGINEFIKKLKLLKENKSHMHLDIDKNTFLIHHEKEDIA